MVTLKMMLERFLKVLIPVILMKYRNNILSVVDK